MKLKSTPLKDLTERVKIHKNQSYKFDKKNQHHFPKKLTFFWILNLMFKGWL